MTGDRAGPAQGHRTGRRSWLAVASLVAAFLLLLAWVTRAAPGWGYDLRAYTAAAERITASASLYLDSTLAGPFRPEAGGLYLYPPPPAVLVIPLAALDVAGAIAAWTVLHVVALIAACWAMPVPLRVRSAVLLVGGLSYPAISDMVLGNVSSFVLLATVLAWRWLERPAGSAALAVAISLRPTAGLVVLLWLLRRTWRPVVWTLASMAVLVLVTLPAVGTDAYRDYLTLLRNLTVDAQVHLNSSLGSTAWRAGLPIELADILQLAAYPIAALAVAAGSRLDREAGFATAVAAPLLAPLLWSHYLLSLLVPVALLIARGHPWVVVLPLLAWVPVLLRGTELVYPFIAFTGVVLVPVLCRCSPVADRAPPEGGAPRPIEA